MRRLGQPDSGKLNSDTSVPIGSMIVLVHSRRREANYNFAGCARLHDELQRARRIQMGVLISHGSPKKHEYMLAKPAR